MASTTFTGGTVIASTWLNDVDDFVYGVKSSGAIGDGTTSDQTALVNAVAVALLTGASLYWPVGTFVSTANIPNLHSVKHVGPGIIKRGSSLFYVQPKNTQPNTIYITTTGSTTNDGLSASEGISTFQAAFDALGNYGPVLDGAWTIQAAAGTYTINAGSHNYYLPSRYRVIIKGANVGGHPNVPTTIIDGGGLLANYLHGLNFDGPNVFVQVQDIKFQNFKSPGNTRLGLVIANGADGYTSNIHGVDCSWAVITFKECSEVRCSGGIYDGNGVGAYGVIVDSCRASFGYGSTGASDGPQTKGCLSAGLYWSTGSQGHIDNHQSANTNSVGVVISENSRADVIGGNYDVGANKYGIIAQSGGVWGSGGTTPTFTGAGTYTAYRAGSGNTDEMHTQASAYWQRVAFDRTNRIAFGFDPTTAVNIATDTITKTAHTLATGETVRYANGGGTDIGGLVTGTTYYAIVVDANNFKLATSAANATAGTAIDLTSVGTGTTHCISEITVVYTIPANRLAGVGKSARIHVMGVMTTITANTVFGLTIGGAPLSFTVPGAASNVAFEIDVEVFEAAGGHRVQGRLSQGLNATRFSSSSGFSATVNNDITLFASTTGSADLLNVFRTDVFLMG